MKTILEMNESELITHLQSQKLRICVIGIGRIGLPTALSFAKSNLITIGVDINPNLISMINSGDFPLKDEPGYDIIFQNVINEKRFSATDDLALGVNSSHVVVLSLPTPMNENNIPDYSALKTVAKNLHDIMEPGKLIIIESTVEPGFIENDFCKILEGDDKKFKVGENFLLGVCPETANPGQILNDFEKLPRLVAGMDDKTQKFILRTYKHVFTVELIPMSNCKTANAVKLTTNVFRDLNIAFVNELAIIFEKAGIDINEVINAAKTKYNFQPHYPGSGVGGPCLPVNSYQMINFAKDCGFPTAKLVEYGRKINESMPSHMIDLLLDAFKEANQSTTGKTILVLGVSYKPNVRDIQITPVEIIINKLKELDFNVIIFDPFFKSTKIFEIITEENLLNSLNKADALIIATPHKEFHDIDPLFLKNNLKTPIVIDSSRIIDQYESKKIGLVYRGIGRGIL